MIAIDFETVYDQQAGLSIRTQGGYAYITDPRFRAYLVSVVGEGIRFCGPVEDFDWEQVHGKDLCAHNARFDQLVFTLGCQRIGQIPKHIVPAGWHCTADLTSWLGVGRSLQQAAHILLRRNKDKALRKQMDGLTLKGARAQGIEDQLLEYCLSDSECCLELWERYASEWPEDEQQISQDNRSEGDRGLLVDEAELTRGINVMQRHMFEAEQLIPWDWSKNKTPCSPKLLAAQCRMAEIPAPASTDKSDPDYLRWDAEYGDQYPWIRAMQDWRSCHTLAAKLESIQTRVREDSTIAVELLYFGAHTGRFSGVGGVNFHNLHRQPLHDVDLRGMFIPRPGMKFFIADLSQIEPRVLAVLSEDWDFLALCEHGGPYEAHARLSMNWDGKDLKAENPDLYALAKARVLSLGYGAGWRKFFEMAKGYITSPEALARIFHNPVTSTEETEFRDYMGMCDEMARQVGRSQREQVPWSREEFVAYVNAWLQVREFRQKNPRILKLWARLQHDMAISAGSPERVYEVELPSGRTKTYWNVCSLGGKLTAVPVRGRPRTHFYGGKLTENLTQAVARDVFVHGYRLLCQHGYRIPLHVHDEALIEAPADTDPGKIIEIMCQRPGWFPDCPLDASIEVEMRYSK